MLSKNGIGLIVLVLSLFGLEVPESELVNVIAAIGTVISFALMIWNQINRPDTKFLVLKKK